MIFDVGLLFYHSGSVYAFTAGEFASLVGVTASTGSTVINLGNPRDLGRGSGEAVPKIAVIISTGLTSACTGLLVNAQFQGSTDSTNWTTYIESGALSTASFAAGQYVLPQDVPRIPSGAALPTYYRMNLALTGQGTTALSSGSLMGGIVIDRAENNGGDYASGFTVA